MQLRAHLTKRKTLRSNQAVVGECKQKVIQKTEVIIESNCYFTFEIEQRIISTENETKQKQLNPQNMLSVSLSVAITRTSSANRAYRVIIDITIENTLWFTNALILSFV